MPIGLVNAQNAKGRIVHFKVNNRDEELDELVSVEPYGGILRFKRGRAALMTNVEWLRVVSAVDVAQLLADRNAAAGREHAPADLYPDAGRLCALFPAELKDEDEALRLILSRSPTREGTNS